MALLSPITGGGGEIKVRKRPMKTAAQEKGIMNSAQAHSKDNSTEDSRDKIEGCTFRVLLYVLFMYCKELSHTEKMGTEYEV